MNEKTTSPAGFDQQLKQALRPGAAPEDLRRGLMRAAKRRRSPWAWPALGIAALLMVLLGGGTWGWLAHWRGQEGSRVVQAALQHYVEGRRMDFTVDALAGNSAEQGRQWSTTAVGFPAALPECLAGQAMEGGCACDMKACRAACYFLRDGRAIYIFERTLRGLPSDPNRPQVFASAGHRALAWNEGGRGHILVEPAGWTAPSPESIPGQG